MTLLLPEPAETLIVSVLSRHPAVEKAALFGSRALERQTERSDVDIALYGPLTELEIERIALDLDDLPLPWHFDLQGYGHIRHAGLRDHIDRVGKVIFEKAKAAPVLP